MTMMMVVIVMMMVLIVVVVMAGCGWCQQTIKDNQTLLLLPCN